MLMPGEDRALMLKVVDPDSVGEVAFEDLWAWYMDRHRKRALFSATQLGVLRGPNANDAQVIRSPRNTQVLSAIPATAPPMLSEHPGLFGRHQVLSGPAVPMGNGSTTRSSAAPSVAICAGLVEPVLLALGMDIDLL